MVSEKSELVEYVAGLVAVIGSMIHALDRSGAIPKEMILQELRVTLESIPEDQRHLNRHKPLRAILKHFDGNRPRDMRDVLRVIEGGQSNHE